MSKKKPRRNIDHISIAVSDGFTKHKITEDLIKDLDELDEYFKNIKKKLF